MSIRRIMTLALASLLLGFASEAETVSRKQAQHMAQSFFNQAAGRVQAPVRLVYDGRRLTTDRLFAPFYVFNQPAGGFVIISAENKTFPILGYSLGDSFDPDRLSDSGKAVLSSYAREVEMVRYDSRVPEQAIAAWTAYPEYADAVLTAPDVAVAPSMTMEQAATEVEALAASEYPGDYTSDLYTAPQWQEMVDAALASAGTVAVGFLDARGGVRPAVVYGRKGDYYHMRLGDGGDWLMRLSAGELDSGRMIADIGVSPHVSGEEEQVETPFSDYDMFAAEVASTEATRHAPRDMRPGQSGPSALGLGGGHFELRIPEEVEMLTVYSLGGAIVSWQTYEGTSSAFVDLSAAPSGFYFAGVLGKEGNYYGFKIHR